MGLEKDGINDFTRRFWQRERAAERFVDDNARKFESSFDFFISGESNQTTLFKGDFLQNYDGTSLGLEEYPLEFAVRVESGIATVRYRIVESRFQEIIGEFVKGTSASTDYVLPHPITDGLKKFIGKSPAERVKRTTLTLDLGEQDGDKEQVIVNRYFNPFSDQPISEVWHAQRDYTVSQGISSDTDVRYFLVPRSYAAILKRTERISGGI